MPPAAFSTPSIGSDPPPTALWSTLSPDQAQAALDVSRDQGLSTTAVESRRAEYGANVLQAAARRRPWRILLAQFADVTVLVLLAAAIIAGALGEPEDVAAIVAIVVLNALLGFVQEYRAEQAMAALGALAAPAARVRRDGCEQTIPSADLVPGDLVLLEAGNIVPADLRLVEVARLGVEEAALTGESQPVEKAVAAAPSADLPLGDQRGMAFKGTVVSGGRGLGVVIATGMRTELGRIAAMLRDAPDVRSPLQLRLAAFGRRLAVLVLALCVVIFVAGLGRGEEVGLMFMTALSLAVAAIPEALPAVITVALALGARRMVRQQALIRRLSAVETLGSVTYICTDKTGTLTENRMRVDTVRHVDGDVSLLEPLGRDAAIPVTVAEALALCTDVQYAEADGLVGDPTETALVRAAGEAGVDKRQCDRQWPRVAEAPFTAERARMTTVHAQDDVVLACTKGAPERVIPRCTEMRRLDGVVPIDREGLLHEAETMAANGLRVLAIAVRRLDTIPERVEDEERALTLVALVGLLDPPRAEAGEAVRTCQGAGIRVVMITGDHPATARAIAERLGIAASGDEVLTGRDLAQLDDDAMAARVGTVRVYARVAPEDKLRIVSALQARGEYAAMTGDGVNDAPALRRANIGVAMGRGGTDVAREASHMVLLDDNFATIVSAVREGRRIYDNIRRFVRFVLSTNSGEIWTLFLAPFLGLPLPLLPIHILWMNLVTDGLPGLALSAERGEADAMQRPPRPPEEGIFAHGLWQHAVWVGLLMAGLALGTQAWAIRTGNAHWQTMTFTVLTLSQLAHVLAIRSERLPLWRIGVFSNPLLLLAVVGTIGLQMLTLYVPAMTPIFRTVPLTGPELALCFGVAVLVYVAVECEKLLIRRRGWYAADNRHR
ncbi:MAG: cation-translocating P-type ATPase [Gemmatimonadaceae bacterium]